MRHPLFAAVCLLLLPALAQGQGGMEDIAQRTVVTAKSAYVALPPEMAAEPIVLSMALSESGRYALCQRMTAKITLESFKSVGMPEGKTRSEISLVLWDGRTHTRQTLWRANAQETHIEQLTWLAKSDVGFAMAVQILPPAPGAEHAEPVVRRSLLRISASIGKVETVSTKDMGRYDSCSFYPATTVPLCVVRTSRLVEGVQGNETTLTVLDAKGQALSHVDLPKMTNLQNVVWTRSGLPLLQTMEVTADGKVTGHTFSLNSKTGTLTRLESDSPLLQPEAEGAIPPKPPVPFPLTLSTQALPTATGLKSPMLHLLWLNGQTKGDTSRILLSSEGDSAQFMEQGEMVVFKSQGAVWAVPLLKMDIATYLLVKQQADKLQKMQHAKQTGLALLMCAQDYDDTLPDGNGINEKLTPYVPDPSILDGFNYTYKGGKLADIASPAETVLGFMQGEGGRAVVYADGHVIWK